MQTYRYFNSKVNIAIVLAAALTSPLNAMAIGAFDPTAEELALLPPYCAPKARKNGNDRNLPDVRRWIGILGESYLHIHHYCEALLEMNRADAAIGHQIEVRELLKDALLNFDYLDGRLPADYALNPEIFTMKGKLLLRMNRSSEALQQFQRAVQLNKNYVPAYAAMYDYYFGARDFDSAGKVIKQGLAASPKSTALLRRQRELAARDKR